MCNDLKKEKTKAVWWVLDDVGTEEMLFEYEKIINEIYWRLQWKLQKIYRKLHFENEKNEEYNWITRYPSRFLRS